MAVEVGTTLQWSHGDVAMEISRSLVISHTSIFSFNGAMAM